MKKKLITLLLISSVVLSGCGNSEAASEQTDSPTKQAEGNSGSLLGQQKTESQDSENQEEQNQENQQELNQKQEPEHQEPVVVFEEVTIVDNEECAIRVTGIDEDSLWGYTINLYLENKSQDKTYMFSVDSATINGVQCDPMFATEVAAGKKSNEDVNFLNWDSLKSEIGEFTDIELYFRVYDSDDWSADSVAEEAAHIYPMGKENAIAFTRELQSTDNVIVDNEYVTAIVTGYEFDDIWGYTANLFLVNKTDKEIMFSVDEVSVNGYMIDPFWADSILPGKCSFSSISWFNDSLQENGITEVEEIEFLFRGYDFNDWMADDFVSEVITLNP